MGFPYGYCAMLIHLTSEQRLRRKCGGPEMIYSIVSLIGFDTQLL